MARKFFLILSNMRSGSTLLETMLSSLDGVFADREVKWGPGENLQPVHLPISDGTGDLVELFERELRPGNAHLVGSKLVFDPFSLSKEAQQRIRELIPDDWAVIHLTRSYRDVFLSRHRGAQHLIGVQGVPIKGPILGQVLALASASNSPPVAPKYISREDCYREARDYLENDIWAASFSLDRERFFQLDYNDIFERFTELVGFLGLDPSAEAVVPAVESPPLEKLPSMSPQKIVANIDELEPIFSTSESLRKLLVLDTRARREFLPNREAYYERAGVRFAGGFFDDAIADCTQAILGVPCNPAVYFLRGNARMAKGDFANAADDFSAGLSFDSSNTTLLCLRGTAYLRQLRFDAAIDDFKRAEATQPNNTSVSTLLNQSIFERDRYHSTRIGIIGIAAKSLRGDRTAKAELRRRINRHLRQVLGKVVE